MSTSGTAYLAMRPLLSDFVLSHAPGRRGHLPEGTRLRSSGSATSTPVRRCSRPVPGPVR